MNVNNKSSVIITLFFALLFIKLDYAFILKESNNLKLLQRFKKRCQNKSINSIRFSKKCHSLGMLNKNEILEKKNSVIMLSNSSKFDYNKIENLIVFGDSQSSVDTNFTDMSYTGNSHSGGKNWPLYLLKFNNNMKLLNFATRGAVVDSVKRQY